MPTAPIQESQWTSSHPPRGCPSPRASEHTLSSAVKRGYMRIDLSNFWMIHTRQPGFDREGVSIHFKGWVGTSASWTKSPTPRPFPSFTFSWSSFTSLSSHFHKMIASATGITSSHNYSGLLKCRNKGIWLASKGWRNFPLCVSVSFNLVIKPVPELPTHCQLPLVSHWLELTGSHGLP